MTLVASLAGLQVCERRPAAAGLLGREDRLYLAHHRRRPQPGMLFYYVISGQTRSVPEVSPTKPSQSVPASNISIQIQSIKIRLN